MSRPGGLTLHHNTQDAVDARLVAPAMTLEPIEHIRIQTNGQLPFDRRPGRRCLLEKRLVERPNIRIVDIGILHAVNSRQVALDRFFVHAGYIPFQVSIVTLFVVTSEAMERLGGPALD